jgi:hypothetical protein
MDSYGKNSEKYNFKSISLKKCIFNSTFGDETIRTVFLRKNKPWNLATLINEVFLTYLNYSFENWIWFSLKLNKDLNCWDFPSQKSWKCISTIFGVVYRQNFILKIHGFCLVRSKKTSFIKDATFYDVWFRRNTVRTVSSLKIEVKMHFFREIDLKLYFSLFLP